MKTGWYNKDEYFIVEPLQNGCRQSLIIGAVHVGGGHWFIMAGVFPCNISFDSMRRSDVWYDITSTNNNPSIKTLTLALKALNDIEQEIHSKANGKQRYIHVDGLDERRLRVYTKVLTKRCNYKVSSTKSEYSNLHTLYKKI